MLAASRARQVGHTMAIAEAQGAFKAAAVWQALARLHVHGTVGVRDADLDCGVDRLCAGAALLKVMEPCVVSVSSYTGQERLVKSAPRYPSRFGCHLAVCVTPCASEGSYRAGHPGSAVTDGSHERAPQRGSGEREGGGDA